jgi:hypothetical protein
MDWETLEGYVKEMAVMQQEGKPVLKIVTFAVLISRNYAWKYRNENERAKQVWRLYQDFSRYFSNPSWSNVREIVALLEKINEIGYCVYLSDHALMLLKGYRFYFDFEPVQLYDVDERPVGVGRYEDGKWITGKWKSGFPRYYKAG